MALAVIGPLAAQRMVSMSGPQWFISSQRLNHRYQGVIKKCSMTPPRLALVVALPAWTEPPALKGRAKRIPHLGLLAVLVALFIQHVEPARPNSIAAIALDRLQHTRAAVGSRPAANSLAAAAS